MRKEIREKKNRKIHAHGDYLCIDVFLKYFFNTKKEMMTISC